ncbi:hypothetical protein [Roseateles sp.]|uniref:hypothetical protein n=1 Tax=Roseateles sp. TaxID=1971397 RepID=UPI0025D54BEB|nr:hypothetical protein [Roseateles sp.]MBV8036578.1 hypothetical protein [Roseateles sp.]
MNTLLMRRLPAICLLALALGPASAAPTDFRVLTNELTEAGELGIEMQASWARPAGVRAATALQGLAELSFGLTRRWELSLQLPVSRVSGSWHGHGANLELTFVADHDEDSGFYWGGRVELGRNRPRGDEAFWATELRPILGWRGGLWHLTFNPGFTAALTGNDRAVEFEPSAKLSYRLRPGLNLGMEYFAEAGEASHLRPGRDRNQLALLVMDTRVGPLEASFGIGAGLTSASDRRVGKVLLSLPID